MTGCVVYMEEIVNLLTDSWIPVSYADGTQGLATVTEVFTLESIRDTAAVREEFNVSLKLLLSALMAWVYATTREPDADPDESWLEIYARGLDPSVLKGRLKRALPAFEFGNDYPAFMQYDSGPVDLKKAKPDPVGRLLFGYPAKNTVDLNKDLFVHDGSIGCLCESCAAQALIHQQRFAGSGGQGMQSSLTGSEGMVAIISHSDATVPLWKNLWLNVLPESRAPEEPALTFRWMKPLPAGQVDYSDVRSEDVAALWYLPRFFKLHVEEQEGTCSLCGRHAPRTVRHYVKRPLRFPLPSICAPFAAYQRDIKKQTVTPLSIETLYSSAGWFRTLYANVSAQERPRMVRELTSNLAFELEPSGGRHQFRVQCAAYIHGITGANKYYPDLWMSRTETLDAMRDEKQRDILIFINDAAVSFLINGSRVLFYHLNRMNDPDHRSEGAWLQYPLQFTECSRMYVLFDSAYRSLMQQASALLLGNEPPERVREAVNDRLTGFYTGVKRRLILEYQSCSSELNATDLGFYIRNYQAFKADLENLKTPVVEEIA